MTLLMPSIGLNFWGANLRAYNWYYVQSMMDFEFTSKLFGKIFFLFLFYLIDNKNIY